MAMGPGGGASLSSRSPGLTRATEVLADDVAPTTRHEVNLRRRRRGHLARAGAGGRGDRSRLVQRLVVIWLVGVAGLGAVLLAGLQVDFDRLALRVQTWG